MRFLAKQSHDYASSRLHRYPEFIINISRKVGTPRKDKDNKKMASIADEYWPFPPNPVKRVRQVVVGIKDASEAVALANLLTFEIKFLFLIGL